MRNAGYRQLADIPRIGSGARLAAEHDGLERRAATLAKVAKRFVSLVD